jgi:hypothetical protein
MSDKAERIEEILFFLNVNGPTHMADIAVACDLTKGKCDPVVRRNPAEFIRVGPNQSQWAAARVSKWWTDKNTRDLGRAPHIARRK